MFRTRPLASFPMKKACEKTQSQIETTGSNEKLVGIYFCFAFVKTRGP